MKALCDDRVIYLGSFSKVLLPGLRLGYLVLPEVLRKTTKLHKLFNDVHTGTIEQRALNNFIKDGHFDRHIYKMKKIYHSKRDYLVQILENTFGDEIDIVGNASGLHMVLTFKNYKLDESIAAFTLKSPAKFFSVEAYSMVKGYHQNSLVLGYGHLSYEQIEDGVKILRGLLETQK